MWQSVTIQSHHLDFTFHGFFPSQANVVNHPESCCSGRHIWKWYNRTLMRTGAQWQPLHCQEVPHHRCVKSSEGISVCTTIDHTCELS